LVNSRHFLAVVLTAWVTINGQCVHCQTEVPGQADQFENSIGINVHLGYTNTLYYNNFPLIESALAELKIRHVRDFVPLLAPSGFAANHSALLAHGVHGLLGVSIYAQPSDIAGYPGLFAYGYLEALEPPNECDASSQCGSPWAANLLAFLPTLSASRSGYPVIGPSFANPPGAPQVGDVSQYTVIGNTHNYKGGWNPGYAGSWGYGYANYLSDALSIQLAGVTNPGQPVISTETGYTNAIATKATQIGYPAGTQLPYDANSITEADAATYMPRVPLMARINGIAMTFIYELLSSPGEDYGLLRGDGSKKPAFFALKNLMDALSDPGEPFTVRPLHYAITGGGATLQHLLLQKRNQRYFLALWLESSVYNKQSGVSTPVQPENIVIQTTEPMINPSYLEFDNTGNAVRRRVPRGSLRIPVGPNVTIVSFCVASSAECPTD
jgi:hypothetical protein